MSHHQQALYQELDHIMAALQACHFPTWALNRLQQRFEHHHQTSTVSNSRDNQPNINTNSNNTKRNTSLVAPYIQGLGEKFQKICRNRGIQVHFRGTKTIKALLMADKDKDHKLQKSGIIYNYKCPHTNCPEQYIGESGRTLEDRVKEHLRALSPIHQHSSTTGHPISTDCFNIIHRESQGDRSNTNGGHVYKGQWLFTK